MFCGNCGNELPDDADFCPRCGQRAGAAEGGEADEGKADSRNAVARSSGGCAWKLLAAAFIICCLMLVPIGIFVWRTGHNPLRLVVNPPISVEMRDGWLSDFVVQVRNDSSRTITANVTIYNDKSYDVTPGVRIDPGETKDFGRLEMRKSWQPKLGDKGFVRVNGYNRVAVFQLMSGGTYKVWFETGRPEDSPVGIE